MIRIHKVAAFIRDAKHQQIDVDRLLLAAGISEQQLSDSDELLSNTQLRSVLTALAKYCPSDFALAHGAKTRQLDWGVVGHAMLSCQSIKQVVDVWVKYSEIIGHPLSFRSSLEKDCWVLEMNPKVILPDAALRFILDDAIACFVPMVRDVTASDFCPQQIQLTISPPVDNHYRQYIDAPINFNRSANRIFMPSHFLSAPIVTADAEVLAMCDRHCSSLLRNIHAADSVAQQVKETLLVSRGSLPTIDAVAKRLGISKRTLNRRLADEQHTFQQLVQDFRRDYAFELLRENILQVKEISHALGFTNVSSFRRVFKEWTGQTVGEWSQRQ